jgi:hypothetical protein
MSADRRSAAAAAAPALPAWPPASPFLVRRFALAMGAPVLAALLAAGTASLLGLARERLASDPPPVSRVDVYHLFVDDTPVPLTVSAAWEKVPWQATRDAVRSDETVWQRLRLEDWSSVPDPLRSEAFDRMIDRYRDLLASPRTWDRMTAEDWDAVPHPIRVLAYRHMAEYWCGYYQVGAAHALPRGLVADTLAAIVMAESWFEHRAVNTNPWGNRDLGVAQASDSARATMVSMFEGGEIDFRLADEQYFNPWYGTRFVAVWMQQLLDDLDGDLEAAIRGYHRGARRAARGDGEDYLRIVLARRRVLRGGAGDDAWAFLRERDRRWIRQAWPWLASDSAPPPERESWKPRLYSHAPHTLDALAPALSPSSVAPGSP